MKDYFYSFLVLALAIMGFFSGCVAVPATKATYITGPVITGKDGRSASGRTLLRIVLPKQDEAASFRLQANTNGLLITGSKINASNSPEVITATADGQTKIIDGLTRAFEAGAAAAAKLRP